MLSLAVVITKKLCERQEHNEGSAARDPCHFILNFGKRPWWAQTIRIERRPKVERSERDTDARP